MFDLTRMDEAEQSLRALGAGDSRQASPAPRHDSQRPAKTPTECPYHRQDVAA